MKAKDYYAKYGERLMYPETPEAANKALSDLIIEFAKEQAAIIEQRNITNAKSILAVIDEMNDKWNALCARFPTEVLRRNGYRDLMYMKLGITKKGADYIKGKRGL